MPLLQTLRARYVFPVTAAPIGEGTVTIEGDRIVAVGTTPTTGTVRDLGNVAIVPGLVNAHTHLELSDFREPVGQPGIGFADWVEQVVAARRRMSYAPRQAMEEGLQESVRLGVTGLGEIAQPGWPSEPFEKARVDATVFLELIAPTPPRVDAALELARRHLRAARQDATWRSGLSPHAPYSVRPELLSAVVAISASERVPVAFHLAESREELELLRSGTGPLRGFLERLGAWDSQRFSQSLRPLDYLGVLAAAHRVLVIHGNYLDEDEIAFLARHAERMAVVYCPRTHAWFRHAAYPLKELLRAGVTVALGTDSRASSPDLSVLAEMRLVAGTHSDVPSRTILELGTLQSARALGVAGEVGSLEPGKRADLAVVALPEQEAADPHDLLFRSDGPVVARWYRGREDA
jgi:cytosine/adenosine deaminase-related metal-dependent hydrolase